jgi:anaerobic magnesium-protoporphyrin IX monomethyl ester cyclase
LNIILASVNAKYIHSGLAIRYLAGYCREDFPEIKLMEYHINEPIDAIVSEIYRSKPKVLGLSCYIWNVEYVPKIVDTLGMLLPELIVILGGPEASFSGETLLAQHSAIDYVIAGEGEYAFLALLKAIAKEEDDLSQIPGLYWRSNGKIRLNEGYQEIADLDTIPSPYEDGVGGLENKLVYLETSRGCPYGCSYCLSSVSRTVRFFSMERVKKDIKRLIDAGVPQVKMIDRSFNWPKERALEIWQFVAEHSQNTAFHFEIRPDLLGEADLDFLRKMPPGLIQFEIGIQSTNPRTIKAIQRNMSIEKSLVAISRLSKAGNIHLHVDLIAGLPHEDLRSFGQSFDDVFAVGPHRIQVGFLKLLPGSHMRENSAEIDCIYTGFPPYEVLHSNEMSYGDLLVVKDVEQLVELYYNSKRFSHSLKLAASLWGSAFRFLQDFAEYWRSLGYFRIGHKLRKLYDIFFDFLQSRRPDWQEVTVELLKFDFLLSESKSGLPASLSPYGSKECRALYRDLFASEGFLEQQFPYLVGFSPREISKRIRTEQFHYGVSSLSQDAHFVCPKKRDEIICFDYGRLDPVTGHAKWIVLPTDKG